MASSLLHSGVRWMLVHEFWGSYDSRLGSGWSEVTFFFHDALVRRAEASSSCVHLYIECMNSSLILGLRVGGNRLFGLAT